MLQLPQGPQDLVPQALGPGTVDRGFGAPAACGDLPQGASDGARCQKRKVLRGQSQRQQLARPGGPLPAKLIGPQLDYSLQSLQIIQTELVPAIVTALVPQSLEAAESEALHGADYPGGGTMKHGGHFPARATRGDGQDGQQAQHRGPIKTAVASLANDLFLDRRTQLR